jgi:hypothetical protein
MPNATVTWIGLAATLMIGSAAVSYAEGFFSSIATRLLAPVRSPIHPDMTVSVRPIDDGTYGAVPTILLVEMHGRRFEQRFDFGLNPQVLWSPDPNRFALTGSTAGNNGPYETAIVDMSRGTLNWTDVTAPIQQEFGRPVRCRRPEPPNVVAVKWLSDVRLVLAAQILAHANCDSHGTFAAYEVGLTPLRVEGTHGQLDAKRRWAADLGPELAGARDECIVRPDSCRLEGNDPK